MHCFSYEAAMKKLETESKEIVDLLRTREQAYDEFITDSCAPYAAIAASSQNSTEVKGFFSSVSNIFGNK